MRSSVVLVALAACTPRSFEHEASPRPSTVGSSAFVPLQTGAWRAASANLLADLDHHGLHLRSGAQQADVQFTGWGRPGSVVTVDAVAPASTEGNRLELEHDGLVEWWIRQGPRLEQGWDLHERPRGDQPLVLKLQIEGVAIDVQPDRVELGRWSMSEPRAWDALERELPTWFEASAGGVLVRVDDRDATWPITVDPLYGDARRTTLTAPTSADFGIAVSGAGDLNGDGYADVIVGDDLVDADPLDGADELNGLVHIYFGGPSGAASVPTATLTGTVDGYNKFGRCLVVANVNGDAFDDVIAVEPSGTIDTERVRAYHGGPGATFDTTVDSTAFAAYTGGCEILRLNANGDVYDDVAVSSAGEIRVYHGSAAGMETTASTALTQAGSITSIDHDNDGFDDLLVGQPTVGATGQIAIFGGSVAGIGTVALPMVQVGSTGFGGALGAAGDVNQDGFDDLLVADATTTRLYLGNGVGLLTATSQTLPASPLTNGRILGAAGDLNGDGFDDVRLSSLDTLPLGLVVHRGTSTGVAATADPMLDSPPCRYSASAAGDVDQDGYDDVICGRYDANEAYVYYGCPDADADGWCDDVDCDDNDPNRNPGAVEIVGDGIDQDCDTTELCFDDVDDDGFLTGTPGTRPSLDLACDGPNEGDTTSPLTDCDDNDPTRFPGATEGIGDGVDQDCDTTELCFDDADDDGFLDGLGATRSSVDLACDGPNEGDASSPTTDCDDGDPTRYPGATEIPADGVDQDCDTTELCFDDRDDDGFLDTSGATRSSTDLACDGPNEGDATTPTTDCDDLDGTRFPGAVEGIGDSVDQDCDGTELCYDDDDDDGYLDTTGDTRVSDNLSCNDPFEGTLTTPTTDCDDNDPSRNPGEPEILGDGIDQDCNGNDTDLSCFSDQDGDGWTAADTILSTDADCDDPGESNVQNGVDCNDGDPQVYPGATETAGDGIDGDCNAEELCYVDADQDGYRTNDVVVSANLDCGDAQEAFVTDPDGDCDDLDPARNPGATELPGDGIDQDCDGQDLGLLCFADADQDGFTAGQVSSDDDDCDDPGEAAIEVPGDCDDTDATRNPGAIEVVADGIDQDCDGMESCYVDEDDDGYRGAGVVLTTDLLCDGVGRADATTPAGDCDDLDASINPGAPDLTVDGIDQDCDGTDAGETIVLCGVDVDGDGYRGEGTVVSADGDCSDPGEITPLAPGGDCNDDDPQVRPNATEIVADGVDQNCDGAEMCWLDADRDGLRGTQRRASEDLDCDDDGEAGADALEDCNDASTDADNDGIGDADELPLGLDPCDPDSDDDSLTDGDELNQYGTDPNLPDTDGGGVDDGQEVRDGTDPLDSNDDGKTDDGEKTCGCRTSPSMSWALLGLAAAAVTRRRTRAAGGAL